MALLEELLNERSALLNISATKELVRRSAKMTDMRSVLFKQMATSGLGFKKELRSINKLLAKALEEIEELEQEYEMSDSMD